ncbi:MAG: cache and HAMP domain-containing protein, partial [Gammaproteobacteria bacterium]|nr:cache and HAMP domain-containing protein [Gammaproteobacteria bacterium]
MLQSYNSLTSVRDMKKTHIENFFNEQISDITVLERSKNLHEFIGDFQQIDIALQVKGHDPYPVNDPMVHEKTAAHEDFFQGYLKDYGFYDVFIICKKHGHVMYSAAKESDYGANLSSGSLKNSGLAEVWRNTLKNGRPTYVDMKPYAPSNNAPAMFLGTPITTHGETAGVLVFQISDTAINKIMKYRHGYGETQEDYLVGQDNLMRSDSHLDSKGHSLKASFANPSTGSVDTDATKAAFSGETDTKIIIDYNDNPVLSAYSSIKIANDFIWAILSEIDEAEVLITPASIRNAIIIQVLVILAIIIALSLILIKVALVNPINRFQSTLLQISDNKDLTQVLDTNAPVEIQRMAHSVNDLLSSLK